MGASLTWDAMGIAALHPSYAFRIGLNSRAPNGRFNEPDQADASCPVPFQKIFRFVDTPNQIYIPGRPVSTEGRFAIVTNVRRDAMDARVRC